MRTETRSKTVVQNYKVYISKDGKEWPTEESCKLHEKRLDGDIIDCPDCNGAGRFRGRFYEQQRISHSGQRRKL